MNQGLGTGSHQRSARLQRGEDGMRHLAVEPEPLHPRGATAALVRLRRRRRRRASCAWRCADYLESSREGIVFCADTAPSAARQPALPLALARGNEAAEPGAPIE